MRHKEDSRRMEEGESKLEVGKKEEKTDLRGQRQNELEEMRGGRKDEKETENVKSRKRVKKEKKKSENKLHDRRRENKLEVAVKKDRLEGSGERGNAKWNRRRNEEIKGMRRVKILEDINNKEERQQVWGKVIELAIGEEKKDKIKRKGTKRKRKTEGKKEMGKRERGSGIEEIEKEWKSGERERERT
ncbi:nucleolar protein 58-like [Zophobas morio]|uniref:nucleolar protein 58-like n=1 Tax=Zophobas morio TaxID=2755281 RepID=UPI0030827B73